MKKMKYIFLWLIILCLPLLIITSNLRFFIDNIAVYEYIIDRYEINRVTGIENSELKSVYQHWIDFYNNRADTPQIEVNIHGRQMELLSEKEVIHLEDVKKLVQLNQLVQVIVFVLILVCACILIWGYKNIRLLFKGIFSGSAVTFGIVLLLALASLCCFDRLFILFHEIGFSNDFWMLNPSRDYLIMMFPGGFFTDIAMFGFGAVMIESALMAGLFFWLMKRRGKNKDLQAAA